MSKPCHAMKCGRKQDMTMIPHLSDYRTLVAYFRKKDGADTESSHARRKYNETVIATNRAALEARKKTKK